jgi:hypothetical protein
VGNGTGNFYRLNVTTINAMPLSAVPSSENAKELDRERFPYEVTGEVNFTGIQVTDAKGTTYTYVDEANVPTGKVYDPYFTVKNYATKHIVVETKFNQDDSWYKDVEGKTTEAWDMVCNINSAGFVNEETRKELRRILEYSYEDEPFFTDEEKECLSIVKGTLTNDERKIMESHVTITKRILSKVHFNKYFKNSPIWAGQHHECLNCKGYPDGLTADELSTDSRIMAVADICDALLATDRPYKKPIPMEKAFEIMRDMADQGNIDKKLVEYLYQCLKQQNNAGE